MLVYVNKLTILERSYMIASMLTYGKTVEKQWFWLEKHSLKTVDYILSLLTQWNKLVFFSKNSTINPLYYPQLKYIPYPSLNKLFTQFPHSLLLTLLNNN